MKNKKKMLLICWILLCVASITTGIRGCGTGLLMNSVHRADPEIKSYNNFYFDGTKVIVDYTVKERNAVNYFIPAGNYWAELFINKSKNEYGYYKIHREPLPVGKTNGMTKLRVINIDNVNINLNKNKAKYFAVIDYAVSSYTDKPFIITEESNILNNLYISYYNNKAKAVKVITHGPYEYYIPIALYPKVIFLYPFAVIVDLITLPLLLLAPRIDG